MHYSASVISDEDSNISKKTQSQEVSSKNKARSGSKEKKKAERTPNQPANFSNPIFSSYGQTEEEYSYSTAKNKSELGAW